MPAPEILYLGDSALTGAAGYLAGVLTHFKFRFDYVPSDQRVGEALLKSSRKLIILSDYPSRLLKSKQQKRFVDQVADGTGLLMIGGWESFHGMGGDWDGSVISSALPVTISKSDDRQNFDQPAVWVRQAEHPILDKLPWDRRPPTIGGLNRLKAKQNAEVLLIAQQFSSTISGDIIEIEPTRLHPLLVTGMFGQGRTAALATDLAPHWVGGFVDWGPGRVKAQAKGSWQIEVGNLYAQFVKNIVTWTGNF